MTQSTQSSPTRCVLPYTQLLLFDSHRLITLTLTQQTLYFFNSTVGTPGQPVRMHLDTGSSDLWVNTGQSSLCSSSKDPCGSDTYNANSSSTYKYLDSDFSITYADGSAAVGDYVTDTVRFSDAEIKNLQFGIGYRSSSSQSIAGIGYPANEAQVLREGDQQYQNLPSKLASEGTIQSPAYSLWLNDLDASTGSILFGGVDRAKYNGELISVPILKDGSDFREFFIALKSVELGSKTLQDQMNLPVLLDSGSTLTFLPNNIAAAIYNKVGAAYSQTQEVAFVPCSLASSKQNLTFRFSDPAVVTVPMDELVLNVVDTTSTGGALSNQGPACLFGIAPAGNSTNVLGDTFLRSAYVVYDMGNNEISLAQTNFNATGSDVEEIGSGKDAVPQASDASTSAATATSTSSEGASPGMPSPWEPGTVVAASVAFLVGFVVFWS